MQRVVITGMGVISPNGNGLKKFVNNTLAGKSGIKKISKFDASETGISVAGEIDDYDREAYVGKRMLSEWIFIPNMLCKHQVKQ